MIKNTWKYKFDYQKYNKTEYLKYYFGHMSRKEKKTKQKIPI